MNGQGKKNWENRTLFHGDNLELMRSMNSRSVHLVATDPPFNKGRDFYATPESLAAGASFQDRWRWKEDVHPEWVDSIQDDWPAAWAVIDWTRMTYGDDMAAFLCFMAVRLIEMRRILRNDGSIYVHCDATASHYLKALMDAIFGRENFGDEIIWRRTSTKGLTSRALARAHDTILRYARKGATWNPQFLPYTEETLRQYPRVEEGTGRRYQLTDLTNPNRNRPNLTYELMGVTRVWRWTCERMQRAVAEGRVVQSAPGKVPRYKRYLDEGKGIPLDDIWSDPEVQVLSSHDAERTGYPTQKPLGLYQRIIRASSNRGDVVFDPFAGCATTPVAAELEGRQWVAADLWEGTRDLVRDRLETLATNDEGQAQMRMYHVVVRTERLVRSDAGETSAPALRSLQRKQEKPSQSRQEMVDALVAEHGIRCLGCNREFDHVRYLELDHQVPRSDGGSNELENRVLLCTPCNRTKSNTLTLTGLRVRNKKDGFMA